MESEHIVTPPTSSSEWEHSLNGRVSIVDAADDTPTFAVRRLDLGGIGAAVLACAPHTLRRAADPEADRGDVIDFWYLSEGTALAAQGGHCELAQHGEMLSTDRRRPLKLRFSRPTTVLHVPLSARRMGLSPREADEIAGRHWTKDGGAVTFLLSVLAGFCDSLDELHASSTAQFGYHLTDLFTLAAGQSVQQRRGTHSQVRAATLRRIQGYARQHLDNPSLDLTSLARQHNVSVRYVQKLFQEHGLSVSRWIRRERLSRCLTDLKDPQKTEVPVAVIGRRWGFATPSYFTRVFREEYGLTPRQIRTAPGFEGA